MDIRGIVQVGSLGGDGGCCDDHVTVPARTNDQKSIGACIFLRTALSEIASPRSASRSPPGRRYDRAACFHHRHADA
jgi:hypothetical protein